MAETFKSLTARIQAQDPTITPEELQNLIAYRTSELVNGLLQEIADGPDTASLRQAIQDRFSLCCEITPATSIYVNVSNELGKNDIPPFSTLPFEQDLEAIKKNVGNKSAQEILDAINIAINSICAFFLRTVIFSQPPLKQIFLHLKNSHHMDELIMSMQDPVKIITAQQPQEDTPPAPPRDSRPGMYL